MALKLQVRDEVKPGSRGDAFELTFLTEHITVRELIRERVYQEVKDFNASKQSGGVFKGLIQPTDSERVLNGFRLRKARAIEWKPQFERACDAFERNQVLVLVDDEQATSLDDSITVGPKTEVTFLRLIPLVGG